MLKVLSSNVCFKFKEDSILSRNGYNTLNRNLSKTAGLILVLSSGTNQEARKDYTTTLLITKLCRKAGRKKKWYIRKNRLLGKWIPRCKLSAMGNVAIQPR